MFTRRYPTSLTATRRPAKRLKRALPGFHRRVAGSPFGGEGSPALNRRAEGMFSFPAFCPASCLHS
ncbi:hypothetical protein HNR46_000192 [Haloferula luteola]|uniref:Uncharacterized protein n=1 Tax=Haloferula luteola TaxID=595692 RepID=A0A840VAN8_9BACT|nr:hypothetical protein [Haloferula luteola]